MNQVDEKMKESRKPKNESDILLEIESLDVEYSTDKGAVRAVRDVSLNIKEGESLGLVGESGSGKSTIALAILNYLDENGKITNGDIKFRDISIPNTSSEELRSIRGNKIAHVAQDPRRSLNPSIPVGKQISEVLEKHQDLSTKKAREKTYNLLDQVNISDPKYNFKKYPHELSGGMQQRILIAMALSCDPDLIIMDEPTSGLDVTTETKILDLVDDLKNNHDTSILLITHDLGVVSETTDRVGVLYAGELMEVGSTGKIFSSPANPYTQGLLKAVPSIEDDGDLESIPGRLPSLTDIPEGCIFADRCEFAEKECREKPIRTHSIPGDFEHLSKCRRWATVLNEPIESTLKIREERVIERESPILSIKNLKKYYDDESFLESLFADKNPVRAVNGINFDIYEGETLGLVGESGCGKSTVARTILGLLDRTGGEILFRGRDINELSKEELKVFRRECEIIFQNPDSSLNPEKSVYEIIERPLELLTEMNKKERRKRIADLLEQVELSANYAPRYPSQLSGGEKQRVAIARAFATNPSLVVLDEPVSALDVSVQASILDLLIDLREEYACSYLFIGHDLSVINYICDRIAIMYLGEIMETGSTEQVFSPPYHPYTHSLLSNIPTVDGSQSYEKIRLKGDVPSARNPPSGCPFHTRCPQKIGEECENQVPELRLASDEESQHYISCHLDIEEMNKLD